MSSVHYRHIIENQNQKRNRVFVEKFNFSKEVLFSIPVAGYCLNPVGKWKWYFVVNLSLLPHRLQDLTCPCRVYNLTTQSTKTWCIIWMQTVSNIIWFSTMFSSSSLSISLFEIHIEIAVTGCKYRNVNIDIQCYLVFNSLSYHKNYHNILE